MKRIERFEINGLFGTRDIEIQFVDGSIILVGPNGIGKSTVINIFYFFVSRQWSRLLEYSFNSISVVFSDSRITADRNDISGINEIQRLVLESPPGSRLRHTFDILSEHQLVEEFFSSTRISPLRRAFFANLLKIPASEVQLYQRSLVRRMQTDQGTLFEAPRVDLERAISDAFPGRTLYLPTYRRIEKDLKEVFPQLETQYKDFTGRQLFADARRSGAHYVDLINFGMEDVKSSIDRSLADLRDYSLNRYNSLSALYLRDVIRGKADAYEEDQINNLTEEDIQNILDRVTETALSKMDKDHLKKKLQGIQGKKRADVDKDEKYLAHYFSRLVDITADIRDREKPIANFIDICNAYFKPEKRFFYDDIQFTVKVLDKLGHEIELRHLSSGEKQIVSVFAHLYLDQQRQQIIVIDEPELSLSVPWQKRFLADILNSGRCNAVVAVTHSPFIYQNDLRETAVDLRRNVKAA